MKYKYFYRCLLLLSALSLAFFGEAQRLRPSDFRSEGHPRVFVTEGDRDAILAKIRNIAWTRELVEELHAEVDPILAIHQNDPGYVISRMQMHWEEGKRYTHFYTEGNFIPRREGNAQYPTVRLTYARAASGSVPPAPLDKIIPYGDGSLTLPEEAKPGIYKIIDAGDNSLSQLGRPGHWKSLPFEQTGLGTESLNRTFIHLAWKSSILYYLSGDKRYAKLSADILWNFVRGAAQQEQVNPHRKDGSNGYLSFETLGDTRHFSTVPLAYDMIYHYLRDEYFDLPQFSQGIEGQMWAPPHDEGKEWALQQFEIVFKKQIENKLNRGGALEGNWNTNEHQSAMLYALALDNNADYSDGKGREYYVEKLIWGPTTDTHGAYTDVLRANISPTTGLWPEPPAGYGQGSTSQLVRFGFIYYKNGIDLLSQDPLLNKAVLAMPQMLFPNGYVTNWGDASYAGINTDQAELMLAYAREKGDREMEQQLAALMRVAQGRNLRGEFYYPLFFYLPEIPETTEPVRLERTSYAEAFSIIFGRNTASDPKDALAFTLMGFGKESGHRQPNGMTVELYGRGHVLAPDQGIGQDYWSYDTHAYKINVAAHNTVVPNGKGADNRMPQDLEILHAEPVVIDGGAPLYALSPDHQFVEAANRFHTAEIRAEQRRMLSIVRTSPQTGYFVDIFRSTVTDPQNEYHDYIYHNQGIASKMLDQQGELLVMTSVPLDTLTGLGYGFFETLGSLETGSGFGADFELGADDTRMRLFMPGESGRTIYQLNSLFNHRYYLPELRYIPVPAVLVRQPGEAWNKPFVAVYEPYGNGAEARIERVRSGKPRSRRGLLN